MAGAVIKSVLEEALEKLPSTMKTQSAKNMLKKQGVKDIELENSGISNYLDTKLSEKVDTVTTQELIDNNILYRPDLLETSKGVNPDAFISIREKLADTYKVVDGKLEMQPNKYEARVYTKELPSGNNHFDLHNYYSHVRFTDNVKGRLVHEIQSDVHQTAKKQSVEITDSDADSLFDILYFSGDAIRAMNDADLERHLPTLTVEEARYNKNIIADAAEEMSMWREDTRLRLEREYADEDTLWDTFSELEVDRMSDTTLELFHDLKLKRKDISKDKNYLQSTLNKLLVDSANEGQPNVLIRIAPDPSLHRSAGIQKWYEKDVYNIAMKTAKKIGAETEMTEEGYLKIKLPKEFSLPLYAATGVTVANLIAGPNKAEAAEMDPKIVEALKEGYSQEEIDAFLGNAPEGPEGPETSVTLAPVLDDESQEITDDLGTKIQAAIDEGYTEEEIRQFLLEQGLDGDQIEQGLSKAQPESLISKISKYQWDPHTPQEEAKDLADVYKNVHGKYSTLGKQVLGIFDEASAYEARREINQLNTSIVDMLNKQNIGATAFISPDTGEVMLRHENGVEEEVDSSILNDLYNSKAELAFAISGAGLGMALGNATIAGLALPEELITGPLGAMVGKGIGTLLGGAAGAYFGKGADLVINSALLKEDLEASLYLTQMKEAAIMDGVATTLGAAFWKLGAKGYRGIVRAYDFVLKGNSQGAYKALLENMHMTDTQAKELVAKWEDIAGYAAPGKTPEEKAIGVISTTQQGAEPFAHFAASQDPKAAMQVIKDINVRAKDIIKAADEVADPNIGKTLITELDKYTKDVKDFFEATKQIANDAIQGTDFRFDYDKLAIDPIVEVIGKKISNPLRKEQFLSYANRIQSASEDRSFSGLLELRSAVNDFKYSKSGLKKPDIDALNKVLNKIDTQIATATKKYMPGQSKEWLEQFKRAKTEYAKMKQLDKNILYKYLMRGPSEQNIQSTLVRHIDRLDDAFLEVMEKLPPKTRAKAEGAVVKQYINRYTLGHSTDMQAVHFPMIAESLKGVNITTPEAKHLIGIIDEMSKVFRNDVNLSKISGNIAVPKFQSYLTTDPVVRLKYEVASGLFNAVKRFVPGERANNLALLKQMEKVLENPFHVDTFEKFIRDLPDESQPQMRSLVSELQKAMKKAPIKQGDFVKMYKQSKSGKLAVTDGQLGKGIYLVDKVKNPNAASQIIGHEVNMSRMATLENISEIVGREVSVKDIRTIPNLQKELVERGYHGISLGNRAMLFPDKIVGASSRKSISNTPIKKK